MITFYLVLFQSTAPCSATNSGQIALGVLTLLGFVVSGAIREWRATRQHNRDIADRERHAIVVERKVIDQAGIVQHDLVERAGDIKAELAENTKVSTNAFKEANNANAKIAEMQENFNILIESWMTEHGQADARLRGQQKAADDKAELIAETVVATHEDVKVIKDEVTGDKG